MDSAFRGRNMRRLNKGKECFFALLFLVLTALMINFASDVLRPAQTSYGSTWSAFRGEPKDSLDVIYLGSSFAYCDFNPSLIYDASGLTGYVMAGGEQPLSITYWYLKEIFRTQSPSAVVLEGTSLYFKQYQNYTQQNVVLMPFSQNKLGAIFTAAEPELRVGLLFDLYFYHSRWQEIGESDIKKALHPVEADYAKGFTPMTQVLDGVGEAVYVQDRQVSPEDYASNLAWLGKILALCREHGAQPIVVFNPSYTRCTPEAYARNKADILALDSGTLVYDWTASFEEIGLIPTEHLYDGSHLNQYGAAIFSAWLGRFLTEEVGLVPRSQTAENTAAWKEAAAWWQEHMAA